MTLRFEEGDDFNDNLERFLAYMESDDPEMSAILRKHAATLLTARDETTRRAARALFNLSVTSDLDGLLKKASGKDAA